jgi:hypothetical protein
VVWQQETTITETTKMNISSDYFLRTSSFQGIAAGHRPSQLDSTLADCQGIVALLSMRFRSEEVANGARHLR